MRHETTLEQKRKLRERVLDQETRPSIVVR